MITTRIPALRNQTFVGLSITIIAIWLAWEIGDSIVARNLGSLEYLGLAFAGCVTAIAILRSWRLGLYFFLVWVLFEDLTRKFLGNNMVIYFAKDVLVGLVYLSLLVDIRSGRVKVFRPPFLFFLVVFFWLGALEVFNPNSPHILYGLMGIKIYFYYIPLMFVGYALIRDDEDLRKFLVINGRLAGVIGVIGIIQAIIGHSFLNPATLAPELRDLGALDKVSPITQQVLSLPTAVFVSAGRFSQYLTTALILTMGSAGYLLLHTRRSRTLVFFVFGIIGAATMFSGSRGAVMYAIATVFALSIAFLWGAPWRWQQAHRMLKAVRRLFIFGALGLAAILLVFPQEAGSRIAFYTETLLPSSSAYQLGHRSWDYPIYNFELAFTNPNWIIGNGIGTASLGTQYVAKIIGKRSPDISVEEGFGLLIIEMGILAPFLWIAWSAALLYHSWKVVIGLRETRLFPIAFAILWYSFLLLYPMTFGSISAFENYVCNFYLWLLVGVLFKLPIVLQNAQAPAVISRRETDRRILDSF
jgi:hypothetical protein